MNMSLAGELSKSIGRVRYEDLPDDLVQATRLRILDTLGVAFAGRNAEGCQPILREALHVGGRAQGTIWGHGDKLPSREACFVNGVLAAALDFDSLHEDAVAHPDIVVLPVALALAEETHSTGRDFLTALACGNELMCRLALSTSRRGNWFPTSTSGVFGATAAAARLLKLDADSLTQALGNALGLASGTVLSVTERTLAKRTMSALAARSGLEAARLAKMGIGGPVNWLEGPGGYLDVFDGADTSPLLFDFGETFVSQDTAIKKYPSCGCNHTAIAAAVELLHQHGFSPDDVEAASVEVTPYIHRVVGSPYDATTDPQVAAQFSVQYSIACVFIRGGVELDHFSTENATDSRTVELARKIEVRVSDREDGQFGPVSVEVLLRDGRRLHATRRELPGSAHAPLSPDEVTTKFRQCAAFGETPIDAGTVEALIDRVARIDDIDDMATFFDNLKWTASE